MIGTKPLSGGDINQVFYLRCAERDLVVKLNDGSKFPGMFSAEAQGLELLRDSKSFRIPQVVATGAEENLSYLLMEFIPQGHPTDKFWEGFAKNLAKLHKTQREEFGLDHDNYIGSLPQYNGRSSTASEFYTSQRLEPQFKMAKDRDFSFGNLDFFYKNVSQEIPNELASLIHGDLWNGNYMASAKGKAVLIDPAVAYAPREMDVAMMMLFGGFHTSVFHHYNSIFRLMDGWENRIDLWQLYYILVHLNLFGAGYLAQAKSIVSKYS